jgi:hypothetical protein
MMVREAVCWRLGCLGAGLLALAICMVGCRRAPEATAVRPAATDPRASFDQIMEQFKRDFFGFDVVMPTGRGTSSSRILRLHYVVEDISYEVFEGGESDAPRKAQMTLQTNTYYSLSEPEGVREGEDSVQGEASRRDEDRGLAGPSRGTSGEQDASEANRRNARPLVPNSLMTMGSKRRVDTYDFVYANGRWSLEAEKANDPVQPAIDSALQLQ